MATENELRDYLKRATVELTDARRRIGELRDGAQEPIAITGMACRYPGGGDTVDGFWDLLSDGRTGVVEVPVTRWNIDEYYDPDRTAVGGVYTRHGSFLPDIAGWDAGFFGHSPQEALRMDPQQRLLMELVYEGFENAGIAPSGAAGTRAAVMVGFMDSVQYGRLETDCYGPGIAADPYFGQGVSASVVAGRLAYHYDLRGPAVTLDSACSSSLVGVHLAGQALRRGECELAIAGGVFLIMRPDLYVQGCATSMLAADGRCKTFDTGADGYVMGEGGGIVVLERLSSALRNGRRIHALLRGSAVNQDGRSNGLTAPSRRAQVEVIRAALSSARIRPDDVDYLEAHGSGTHLGDAIELSALHDVFGGRSPERPLHVGAVKTNLGHTQAAAGIAGLIKTVLVLERGQVPANLHLSEPAAAIPADGTVRPVVAALPLLTGDRRAIAGVSSFGWSGTNAHVVLEAAPPDVVTEAPEDREDSALTLALSAASGAALREQVEQLTTWIATRPDLDPADVAHTLAVGRSAHDYRITVPVAADSSDILTALTAAAARAEAVRRARSQPRVAFLLDGTGDQYAGAAQLLYRTEPVFTTAVDRCLAILTDRCGVDVRAEIDPPAGSLPDPASTALFARPSEPGADTPLEQAEIAHPYLFTIEYALATLLGHWGVAPDVLIGYSLGEYVAACLAGVFTLDDALYLVVERARLIASAAPGRMVAVAADEPVVRAALAAADVADVDRLDVAAFNGPAMTVLSGTTRAVDVVTRTLLADGIACRPMRTVHAFHSSLLEPVRDKLAALVGSVPRRAPKTTIVSNRTGAVLRPEEATDPQYWADHLVSPVRFADGVRECLEQSVDVFVELGCGQTLAGLARQNLPGTADVEMLGTLPARWNAASVTDMRGGLLATCGRLWENGVDVNWAATNPGNARIVTLPTYPFQRTPFWPEPADPAAPAPAPAAHSGPRDLTYAPSWQRDAERGRADAVLSLTGPLVVFADGDGVGAALADRAEQAGIEVLEVIPGDRLLRDGRRLTIDSTDPGHYRELVEALPDGGPITLAHLWSLRTSGLPLAADTTLSAAIRHGFDSLLLAIQALGETARGREVRLLTVSRGATEILGGDGTAPQQAIGHGLGRSARHEYPGLTWSGVDLDPEDADPELADPVVAADQLVRELTAEPGEHPALTGWRRSRRWLPDFVELPAAGAPDPGPDGPTWRPEGVYLITGGTRGLGLALARHLVRSGVRRLALVSRSGRPDGEDDRATRTRADLDELAASGAEILLLAADAGEPAQLRAALRRCREHYGKLTGVVHAAGLPAGGMVARSTVAGAGKVLAPKVRALGPLAELVGPDVPAGERPELLVLYSSAVTAYGGIGESDYCAANTVLDAYGTALAGAAPGTRVVSVAWGPWQHDDWQARADGIGADLIERAAAYRQTYGFTDQGGCALLDSLAGGGHGGGHGAVLAVRQPLAAIVREWSTTLDLDALLAATEARSAGERFARPALRVDFVAPRTELEVIVAEAWGSFLGIDQVGVHDPFFDLGGNSLVGLAMVRAVEQTLGRSIPPALLYAHPTVAEFATGLDPDSGTDDAAHLQTSSARGQRRRRTRPGTRR